MEQADTQQASDTWAKYEARQGRKATFDEIGDVVVLLSTPRMSLVVGHNLVIDGYVSSLFGSPSACHKDSERSCKIKGADDSTLAMFLNKLTCDLLPVDLRSTRTPIECLEHDMRRR